MPTKTSKATRDHDVIRKWTEDRGGQPARVKRTGGTLRNGRAGGLLRIDFQDKKGTLEPVSWEEFFEIFDTNNLMFLYQDKVDGKLSRFFKFINRETAEEQGNEDFENDDATIPEEDDDDTWAVNKPAIEIEIEAVSNNDDEPIAGTVSDADDADDEDDDKEDEKEKEKEDDDEDDDDDDDDGLEV